MGYVDGSSIEIIDTFAGEKLERYEQNADALTKIPVDIIVANSRPATLAAQKITKDIPTIFILIPDPVGTKLVQRLAHPGGNITGLTHVSSELAGKRLELIKEATGAQELRCSPIRTIQQMCNCFRGFIERLLATSILLWRSLKRLRRPISQAHLKSSRRKAFAANTINGSYLFLE